MSMTKEEKAYQIARAVQKKRERGPKVKCKIKGCICMIPISNISGLCRDHWRNRKKLKSSGYYEND